MKIRKLKIENFRGIKKLEWIPADDRLICLVGHGDSAKTTVLKAIEYVLYPKADFQIKDTDFYLCNPVSNHICIEITIGDLSEYFKHEDDLKRYWDKTTNDFCLLSDYENDTAGSKEIVYSVALLIDNTMDPTWELRGEAENAENMQASKRKALGLVRLDSLGEYNFKWKYNTLLTKLTESGFASDIRSILSEAGRETRNSFDVSKLPEHLSNTAKLLSDEARIFGVGHDELKPHLDIFSPDAICLHDSKNVPIYMLGEGSKKLLLLAMEKTLLESKKGKDDQNIVIIDEIERGLEPHRLRHLILLLRQLVEQYNSQAIITTHSPTSIVEIGGFGVYRIVNNSGETVITRVSDTSTIRKEPEGFFINHVILCEGNTELGILRAFKQKWREEYGSVIEHTGAYFIRAHGDEVVHYAKSFSKELGYSVCLYRDSDKKLELPEHVQIFDYDGEINVEKAICKDAPEGLIKDIVNFCIDCNASDVPLATKNVFDEEYRNKLANFLHDFDSRGVFRSIGNAEKLGEMILKYKDEFPKQSTFIDTIDKIKKWIYADAKQES